MKREVVCPNQVNLVDQAVQRDHTQISNSPVPQSAEQLDSTLV